MAAGSAATALVACIALAGCGSSGEPAATSGPAVSSGTSSSAVGSPPATVATTPAAAAADTPVTQPASSPSVIHRALHRPAGARAVDFSACAAPAGVVLLYMENQIFASSIRDVQLTQLPGLAKLAAQDQRAVAKARRTFHADGYPASFPIVKDLDAIVAADAKIVRDARAKKLDAMPADYLARKGAGDQFGADTRVKSICPT